MTHFVFKRQEGIIEWGELRFHAVSGGFGPVLPAGKYTVKKRHVVVGPGLKSGFRNPLTGEAWFIPLQPQFHTNRNGLGIHPDGNKTGTLGCIGIRPEDSEGFWEKWMETPMPLRPDILIVK